MTTAVKVGLGLATGLGLYLALRKGKDGLNSIQRLLGSSPKTSIPRTALTVDETRTVDSKFNAANGKRSLVTAETGSTILGTGERKKRDKYNQKLHELKQQGMTT